MALQPPLVIVGGGLAGSLAALCLSRARPDVPILLLEEGDSFGGNHTWSFFDTDLPEEAADIIAALQPVRWPRHRVRFPARERLFDLAYNAVASPSLDTLVRGRLPPESWRTGATVTDLAPDGVTLASGERIPARAVIDARGPDCDMPGLELGWQKFVGIEFAAASMQPDCALVMDATIPQRDGYRFVYILPMAPDRVLVEDTYYSDNPALDVAQVAGQVRHLAAAHGLVGAEVRQETGVLPILLDGDPAAFWPAGDGIARLGLRGGFFQPTTGYSFGIAMRLAFDLANLPGPLSGDELARWTRGEFLRRWRAGRFYRLINRMLFRAGDPGNRWKVLQHFYRLPPDLIARFYAGQLSWADKLRILSGRPPVPIGQALAALVGHGQRA